MTIPKMKKAGDFYYLKNKYEKLSYSVLLNKNFQKQISLAFYFQKCERHTILFLYRNRRFFAIVFSSIISLYCLSYFKSFKDIFNLS